MKKELTKLHDLKNYAIGVEINISNIERDLQAIFNNLTYLYKIEAELVLNLKILKSRQTIPLASEYRRSVEELGVTRERLIQQKKLEKELHETLVNKILKREELVQQMAELENLIQSKKVILLFDKDKRKKRDEG